MVQTLDGHWQTQPTDGHFSFVCVANKSSSIHAKLFLDENLSVFSVLCIYLTHRKLLLLRIKAQRKV